MSLYSSLLALSPTERERERIGGVDDDMAAAVSTYLSFDIDVGLGEEYYPPDPEAAVQFSFHSEQQQPPPAAPVLLLPAAALLCSDDHGDGGGESSRQSQPEVGHLSSEALSGHDKGSTGRLPTAAKGSKIAFKTRTEVDVLDDGYRWRKYGKKMVKNSPSPRNYYRCWSWSEGCRVKKRVERARDDARFVITTYHGVHTHPTPAPRRTDRNVV